MGAFCECCGAPATVLMPQYHRTNRNLGHRPLTLSWYPYCDVCPGGDDEWWDGFPPAYRVPRIAVMA